MMEFDKKQLRDGKWVPKSGYIVYAFDGASIPALSMDALRKAMARIPEMAFYQPRVDGMTNAQAYAEVLCWEIDRAFPGSMVCVRFDATRVSVDLRRTGDTGPWPYGEGDVVAIADRVLAELRVS